MHMEKVFISSDSSVQKSKVLIAKAGELRASGVKKLEECIQHLSEAISTLGKVCSENTNCNGLAHHLMASAYCLRALCSHERAPLNSKEIFDDIQKAINLWLFPYKCHPGSQSLESMLESFDDDDDGSNIMVKEMLKLVYDVLDLLSIKGYSKIQPQIFDVVIILYKWKKFSIEEVLSMLWESRKLRHTLCAAPIHEFFITELEKNYGKNCNSSIFWMKCMESSKHQLVGFKQSFLSSLAVYLQGSFCHGSLYDRTDDAVKPVGSNLVDLVSVDEVKFVASNLISKVPISATSNFLSAYLYYDLSDQLILKGQVVEALRSAKESLGIRLILFKGKFKCSIVRKAQCYSESADCFQKCCCAIDSFHLHDQVAYEAWGSGLPGDFECDILSPWMVLQCYLESILQVGMIQEILGNGTGAECFLSRGKAIAHHHCLPIYEICFSNLLAKLYCKGMMWELAEKEITFSSQKLTENMEIISCLKCRKVLEISISQQHGDLFKIRSRGSTRNPSMEMLSRAGEKYLLALRGLQELNNSFSSPEEDMANQTDRNYVLKFKMDQSNLEEIPSRHRRIKKEKAPSTSLRITRSMSRSLKYNCGSISESAETPSSVNSKGERNSPLLDCTYEVRRLCNKMKCWHCLALQAVKTLSLDGLVHMKLELIWRRLSLVLVVSIGECFSALSEIHKAHHILLLSTSILLSPSCEENIFIPLDSVVELIGKKVLVDVLSTEQNMLLYHICQIALENYNCKFKRDTSCLFSSIGVRKIVSWLKFAFLHCYGVPLLFHKVSKLLTVIHVLSTSMTDFSLPSKTALSESHWAAFFQQASIESNGSFLSCTGFASSSICHSLRVVDKSEDLDEVASKFYERLPVYTTLCISTFQGSDAYLLSALLSCTAQVWILLCRLTYSYPPVLVLLPINSVLDESSVGTVKLNACISYDGNDPNNHWHCPWLSSVIDEAASIFKFILRGNSAVCRSPRPDTMQATQLWWSQRETLDHLFGEFLGRLESLWLGSWKYLLLGDLYDNTYLRSLEEKLISQLVLKYKDNVPHDLLRVILVGAIYAPEIRQQGLQLLQNKGCFIGGSCEGLSHSSSKARRISMDVFQAVLEGEDAVERIKQLTKKPVILVLDSDIQMLPWESLPILRSEEVYRMPYVACICATLLRLQDRLHSRGTEVFPLIDPFDCFYLLNPGGDLLDVQRVFENWFRDQNFEGKAGAAPKVEELVAALKNHDLFIYVGHGSGDIYIPRKEIEKLEGCAATMLMGCRSGSLSENGCYPHGAPLSYLLAGSPIIVANLWDVTSMESNRFTKTLLHAWFMERSNCTSCTKNKPHGASYVNPCTDCCNNGPRVGFFMEQARKACRLTFLTGAATVCYGVPTGITQKKEL